MDTATAAFLIAGYGSIAVLSVRAVLRAELARRREVGRDRMPLVSATPGIRRSS